MSPRKNARELLKRLPGWRAAFGRHLILEHESGAKYHCASTPSDCRNAKNVVAQCRRLERAETGGDGHPYEHA